jgi:hypothetical protein
MLECQLSCTSAYQQMKKGAVDQNTIIYSTLMNCCCMGML